MEEHNWKLARKYGVITENETRHEEHKIDDADLTVAYGTAARIAKGAIKRLREHNRKVGLFRPITLCHSLSCNFALFHKIKNFLVFETSTG